MSRSPAARNTRGSSPNSARFWTSTLTIWTRGSSAVVARGREIRLAPCRLEPCIRRGEARRRDRPDEAHAALLAEGGMTVGDLRDLARSTVAPTNWPGRRWTRRAIVDVLWHGAPKATKRCCAKPTGMPPSSSAASTTTSSQSSTADRRLRRARVGPLPGLFVPLFLEGLTEANSPTKRQGTLTGGCLSRWSATMPRSCRSLAGRPATPRN